MEKNLAASGQHFLVPENDQRLAENLLVLQHFGRKSNLGQDFFEDFLS